MPTECERSATPPTATNITITAHIEQKDLNNMDKDMDSEMSTSTGSTSSTITNGLTASNGGNKKCVTTPCSTAYVAKARVTRPTPPPPSCNPLQFVQIKPCNLYQTAQQQLKKAEEVKMIKEIKKEEPEDWQNNLDSWKSSRRKRVEHIIDRVVEVKKLELEEHDRSRRKSKTFSEMIEERGERGVRGGRAKLVSLAVYNEEETNDLSDLGIGTSSASGKSSLSEDYDNNSVMSDTAELDKAIFDSNHPKSSITREYISSPGYDTSSSTAPASSPDPCEYTYEGAIQDYKQRVSRATSGGSTGFNANSNTRNKNQTQTPSSTSVISIELTSEIAGNSAMATGTYPARRGSKIEERLIGFEVSSPNDSQDALEKNKVDVPKIDISKRKELFESATCNNMMATSIEPKLGNSTAVPRVTLRDRFVIDTNESLTEKQTASKKDIKRLSGDMTSIKDRMQSLEQQHNLINITNGSTKTSTAKKVDIPVPPLKERLSSLQSAATKEETKKPVVLVDARQLEIMKDEEENAILRMKCLEATSALITKPVLLEENSLNESAETEADRDDSGIHTSDDIEEDQLLRQTQEQQLNEAIAALAIEEKQLEQAANAVNQIEAEFEELSSTNISVPLVVLTTTTTTETNVQPCEMEFSINEALELALEAIDKETTRTTIAKTTKTLRLTNDDNSCINKSTKTQTNSIGEMKNQEETRKGEEEKIVIAGDEDEDEEVQQRIQKEPIYENISTTSMPQVDVNVKIIPNNNKLNTNNQNSSETNPATTKETKNFVDNTSDSLNITNVLSLPSALEQQEQGQQQQLSFQAEDEPYYQVPKSSEPYYDAPKYLRPVPVYENIEVFYNGLEHSTLLASNGAAAFKLEPPKEKPPPPPTECPPSFANIDSIENTDNWSSDNTYETISRPITKVTAGAGDQRPSPPIQRMNSTKRIKKELRHKRSSFLGIEGSADDDLESYFELTVAPPPDMAQLLQEERRLEKQLYMKAGLCDSSDTGESRDSGVSENHSRQSSEPFTNSSEETDRGDEALLSLSINSSIKSNELIFQNEAKLLTAAQTPLLQTVKGNSAESWTESATAAAAATKSLTEATATANAKMLSIEEKIREQEEVLRVERELLQLEQEELKRQRENLMLRENLARRELQHGAKMFMSVNRRSLQDLNVGRIESGVGFNANTTATPVQPLLQSQQHPPKNQQSQQIYANVPNLQQQYYQVDTDYRKSMSDLNEFSKRLMLAQLLATPMPPTKPMRAPHATSANGHDDYTRQRHSLNTQNYGGSLVKIASSTGTTTAVQQQSASVIYSNYQHHQSAQNLSSGNANNSATNGYVPNGHMHTNMTRNTLHALSATPKPKYTDGWVQVQNRKSDSNLSSDPAWLSAYQQKRKSVPDTCHYSNNHCLMQETEQRRLTEQQQRRSVSTTNTPVHQQNVGTLKSQSAAVCSNGKSLPDSIIQTLTERVQSKGIGERKRFDNYSNMDKSFLHAASSYYQQPHKKQQLQLTHSNTDSYNSMATASSASAGTTVQDKVLSVSGKKKCSHCGDELGRGAAMIIESLLLFYHINCFKCCVCHMQLGDGLNGTDVRVRNHKLHCQNCYSSDDGIKFSCV